MVIYGTAVLSFCLLVGLAAGQMLGLALGASKNIGGVGIAMLLLIVCCDKLQKSGRMPPPTERGIAFWSSIYIPIGVAMAAKQNVVVAVNAGTVAVAAGVLASIACVALPVKIKTPISLLVVDHLPRNAMSKVTKPDVKKLFT